MDVPASGSPKVGSHRVARMLSAESVKSGDVVVAARKLSADSFTSSPSSGDSKEDDSLMTRKMAAALAKHQEDEQLGGRRSPKTMGSPVACTSRRGTVADMRSLAKKRIVIEGLLRIQKGTEQTRHWFVLDQHGADLKGYNMRPLSDQQQPSFVVSLEDVNAVLRVKNKTEFKLCDSAMKTVAHLVCDDESTLLWWLHGFQRRIFEQTKGFLRERAGSTPVVPTPPPLRLPLRQTATAVGSSPLPSSLKGFVEHRQRTNPKVERVKEVAAARPVSPVPSEWITVTLSAQIGRRKTMEDETVVVLDMNKQFGLPVEQHGALSAFCIYDGHAGRECAEYASEFMLSNLVETPPFKLGDLPAALSHAFVQTDAEFRDWAMENECISGSTAIAVVVRDRSLVVANCGDCRAVLCRAGQALDLSIDHKPQRADERARVEQCGGWVEDLEVLNIPKLHAMGLEHSELLDEEAKLIGWVVVSKVMGALAMTRSFGDVLIKDQLADNFDSALESGAFAGPLILAEPEVKTVDLTAQDAFVIIACDGLWDVFSSQESVVFVLEALEEGVPKGDIPDRLIDRAVAMGTLDNVSVVIVWFDHARA